MVKIMEGIRVLEIAQHTFVPIAGAVLADWGADVIKIEHPVRGDAARGFINLEGAPVDPNRNVMVGHSNRGKRSVGVDVSKPEGQQIIYEMAKDADVFLTNYLPDQRAKLNIDIEHIRAANPNIIYARGSAFGDLGPERSKGGFDSTGFWARGGSAMTVTPEELGGPLKQPGPAYGDVTGGMYIAGGISAALYHRLRTGEALELDVSLLSAGTWALGMSVAMAIEMGRMPFAPKMPGSGGAKNNPFVGIYETSDKRHLNLTILTPGPYIEDTWNHLGLSELNQDPRFNTVEGLMANGVQGSVFISQAIAAQPLAYWIDRFSTLRGQWAPYQNLLELVQDQQVQANNYIFEVELDGQAPMKLVGPPVQFNHESVQTSRAPEASEHTELVLMEMGMEWDRIEELKAKGVVA